MDAFIAWIGQHPDTLLWMVFAVTFIETFAFLGALVPGVVALFGIAAWASSTQTMGLAPLLATTAVATASSSLLSFYWGYRLRHRIHHIPFFVKHHSWLNNSALFFEKWGPLSIMIGRFIGPVRPFVAFVAGSLGFSPKRFVLFDLIAVLVWAPAYIVPGYLAGLAVDDVILTVSHWPPLRIFSLVALLVVLVLIVGNYWMQSRRTNANQWVTRLHMDELPLASSVLVLAVVLLFFWVPQPFPLDNAIMLGFGHLLTDNAAWWAWAVWSLGHESLIAFQLLITLLFLALLGRRDAVLLLSTTAAVAFVGFYGLGEYLLRQRIDLDIAPAWYHVSIGTAQFSLILGATAALICEGVKPTQRWMIYLGASLVVISQMIATMALGFATLTSLVLGLYLGVSCNALLRIAYSFVRIQYIKLHRKHWPVAFLLLLTTASYVWVQAP